MPVKNQSFLIDIFKYVNNIQNNSRLLLIGGGNSKEEISYKQEIQNKVKKLGLEDRVIFTGVREDVNNLMEAMDIFVMPSLSEGFPVTLVEAQAAGLRCLVSDNVQNDVNLTGEIQYKALEDGEEEWGEKVLEMVNIKIDMFEMEKRVKKAGFDISDNVKLLKEFYVLASRGK